MASGPRVQALRARWLLPVASPPIAGGVLTFAEGKIVAVGKPTAGVTPQDLGDVAILPGLVNAHTHLEFSDLAAPLGTAGNSLPEWIRRTVGQRRASTPEAQTAAIELGLGESVAAGTTTLGDIATSDWRRSNAAAALRGHATMFYELIAPVEERVQEAVDRARSFLASESAGGITPALSPHAPYTVRPDLLLRLAALACEHQAPLAMHLAESPEELELIETGGGPFRDLLVDFGSWDAQPAARLPGMINYLEALSQAPRALVIHGNFLNAPSWAFLAERRKMMAVVYCPRTHHFFRHPRYPLVQMLQAGVTVALGTDSRASSPDLSLFEEMRFVADRYPELDPATVLSLGTLGGAQALGLASRVGSLEAGKQADFAVVRLGQGDCHAPYSALFASDSAVEQTWIAGQLSQAIKKAEHEEESAD